MESSMGGGMEASGNTERFAFSAGLYDDFPLQIIVFTGGPVSCTGSVRASRLLVPQRRALPDMEEEIHGLERGAYNAVLKAFIAQSDDLSWSKEKLMSELRKELRVSDVEHRESLAIVDSDDFLRHIRERRTGGARSQELLPVTPGMVSSSTNLPRKKLKTAHLTTAASPNCLPWVQSSSALPSGHLVISSSNYMLPHAQPSPTTIPSVHKRNNKWIEDKPVNQGNTEGAVKPVGHHIQMPGKGRGTLKVHFGKSYAPLPGGGVKKGTDKIEIRDTHIILDEVERVCRVANPDPVLVEKAKLILKEHEQSLLDAIEKLGSMSDFGASLEEGYTHGEHLRTYGTQGSDRDQPDKTHTKSADRQRNQ